jgi:aldose 1-epimerase
MTAELLTLTAGDIAMDVWPGMGGSIVEMRHRGRSFTQPLVADWAAQNNPSRLAFFAMTPWFSRIDGGRFVFDGEEVVVPNLRPDLPPYAHGYLRLRRPELTRPAPNVLVFTDEGHDPPGPYHYRSVLRYALEPEGLAISLDVTHLGPTRMPYGVGFHPFFARTPDLTLAFEADGFLETDESMLPVGWRPITERPGLAQGVPALALMGSNNSFTGWAGKATLHYPERGLRLMVTAKADAPMALHLFVPHDRDILCIEPVTNVPNVINRRAFARFGDMVPLAQGETLSATMRLDISQ